MGDRNVVKEVIVSKTAAGRVARFFPWVYENELVTVPRDVGGGEVIRVSSPSGGFLGVGYINQTSTIAVRVLSFTKRPIDQEFFREKIAKAWQRRAVLGETTNAFRVVHSEADGLPGLVADYYNGFLSLQVNTAGMERLRREILAAFIDVVRPAGIYERSDAGAREKEGLGSAEGVLYGEIPEELTIEEGGVLFKVRLRESQKTGFYLDQRRNRGTVASYVGAGYRVLDVFSNTGGFGLYAAAKGAGSVTLVDQSAAALEAARENVSLNGMKDVVSVKADAFAYLAREAKQGKRYDLVVLDPPSFAKAKDAKGGALKGYRRLVLDGLRILKPEGYLAVFSCSHHISLDDIGCACLNAAADADCRIEVLEHLFQDTDHPYILNIPQSLYLKGLLTRKTLL
ncbi:MAG TPA: class I SAM-dependent rRNA methyltransferase [Syntrophales bacterium]|nr:class I SAM-dependent rRNA methyltransferase [Syntrophales bacterium]